jgi:hypothetical protein
MAVASEQQARRAARITGQIVAWARRWSRVLGTSAGTAAVAGAGQLGIAYGLGLVHFPTGLPSDGMWEAQLTWAAWIAALAVLAGAAGGAWMARREAAAARPGARATLELGQRIVVALVAAAGAGVVIFLTALPVHTSSLPGSAPALEAALATLLGIVVGILVAVAALSLRVAAVSVTAIVAVAWLMALVSLAPTLGPDAQPALVRLGVLDLPALGEGSRSTVAVLSAPVLALLLGTGLAAAARSRGLPWVHTVVSGAAGPALLALPYLIAPPAGDDRAVQAPAFGGALVAALVGLLAAVMVALARMPGGPAGIDADSEAAGTGARGTATTGVAGTALTGTAIPQPRGDTDQPPWAPPGDTHWAGTAGGPEPFQPSTSETPPAFPPRPDPPPTEPPSASRAASLPDPPSSAPPASRGTWPEPPPAQQPPAPPLAWQTPPPEPVRQPPRASAAPPEPVQLEPEPAGPEPPPAPASEPAPQAGSAEPPRKRGRRHKDDEHHVDWVRSLAGETDEDDDPSLGKRRLRRPGDPSDPD